MRVSDGHILEDHLYQESAPQIFTDLVARIKSPERQDAQATEADEATEDLRSLVKEALAEPSGDAKDLAHRIKELVGKGADLNAGLDGTAPEKDTGLLQAAALAEDTALIEALLGSLPEKDRKAVLNKTWRDGNTVMHALGIRGDKALFDRAVDMGGDAKVENVKGVTPEHLLAEHRKRGLPLIAAVSLGGSLTPAGWAVLAGIGVAALVAHFIATKNAKEPPAPKRPFPGATADDRLGTALFMGDEEAALAALEGGADPAKGYSTEISFLLFAAATGQDKVARAMVERLAGKGDAAEVLNARGVNGMTPALAAAFEGNRSLVDYFKTKGADLTARETLSGLTVEEALEQAERRNPLDRRGIDDLPYWPGRGRFRGWIRRRVASLRHGQPTVTQPPPSAPSPPETGLGGDGAAFTTLVPVEPDPEGVTTSGWRPGVENNAYNMGRVRERAEGLLDQLNTILGTDYELSHNFNLASFGAERAVDVPLFAAIGMRVFGDVPEPGFFDPGALRDERLRNHDFAEDGGLRSEESQPLNEQSFYILHVLSSLVNVARTNGAWRDNIRRFLGLPTVNYTLYAGARANGYDRDADYIGFDPYSEIEAGSARIPPFVAYGHEIRHVLEHAHGDPERAAYDFPRGEFEGQTAEIDGVPVVWRDVGSGQWFIPFFGDELELPYVEARTVGIGPFSDPELFPDTERAIMLAYGHQPRASYRSPDELSEPPGTEHPAGVWGDERDPWNRPGWVPPPAVPSMPTNLSKTAKPRPERRDLGDHPLSAAKDEDYRRLLNTVVVALEGGAAADKLPPLTEPPLRNAFRDLVIYNLFHQDEVEGLDPASLSRLELARDKALKDILETLPEKGHDGSEPRRAFQDYLDKDGREDAGEVAKAAWSQFLESSGLEEKPADPDALKDAETIARINKGDFSVVELARMRFGDDAKPSPALTGAIDRKLKSQISLSPEAARELRTSILQDKWSEREYARMRDSRVFSDNQDLSRAVEIRFIAHAKAVHYESLWNTLVVRMAEGVNEGASPLLTDDGIDALFKDMVLYNLFHQVPNLLDEDDYLGKHNFLRTATETAVEDLKDRIGNHFKDDPKRAREAARAVERYLNSKGGKGDAAFVAQQAWAEYQEATRPPRPEPTDPYEKALGSLISDYTRTISLGARKLPHLEGSYAERFKQLVTHFLGRNFYQFDPAKDRDKWVKNAMNDALDAIRETLPEAYGDAGSGELALDIFEGYLSRWDGTKHARALAEEAFDAFAA